MYIVILIKERELTYWAGMGAEIFWVAIWNYFFWKWLDPGFWSPLYAYPEINGVNFKCTLWTFKHELALLIRVRCGISIVLLQIFCIVLFGIRYGQTSFCWFIFMLIHVQFPITKAIALLRAVVRVLPPANEVAGR